MLASNVNESTRSQAVSSVMLTPGWEETPTGKAAIGKNQQNTGDVYFEELSELTVDSDTVAKVLEREKGVDRRRQQALFKAFNLQLREMIIQANLLMLKSLWNEVAYANERQRFYRGSWYLCVCGRKKVATTAMDCEDRCQW